MARNEPLWQRMLLGKDVNPPFEIRVEAKSNMPLVEFDSDWSWEGPSFENLVGYEKPKLSRLRAVVVVTEQLDYLPLGIGVISNMVPLQTTGAILILQTTYGLWAWWFLR